MIIKVLSKIRQLDTVNITQDIAELIIEIDANYESLCPSEIVNLAAISAYCDHSGHRLLKAGIDRIIDEALDF